MSNVSNVEFLSHNVLGGYYYLFSYPTEEDRCVTTDTYIPNIDSVTDLSYVRDGTWCADMSFCHLRQCTHISDITGLTNCPRNCFGNGVCNEETAECECVDGSELPDCEKREEEGGSVDRWLSQNSWVWGSFGWFPALIIASVIRTRRQMKAKRDGGCSSGAPVVAMTAASRDQNGSALYPTQQYSQPFSAFSDQQLSASYPQQQYSQSTFGVYPSQQY